MRAHAPILAGFCAAALTILAPASGSAQTAYGFDEGGADHRVLTVRPRRAVPVFEDCGVTYACRPSRAAAYDVDDDASDPFSTCVSGCDIDVIFRTLTGRPAEGWKR